MHFILYQDALRQWRWRLRRDGNYKTLADSGEGYLNKSDCTDAIALIKTYVGSAPIYE